jgi:hypothetical protein
MDYHYWSFVEVHHAHVPLPSSAALEAIDILMWCYTSTRLDYSTTHIILMFVGLEHFVPSSTSSLPFSQDACQELIGHLRSLDSESCATLKSFVIIRLAFELDMQSSIESTVRTQIIATILLRTGKTCYACNLCFY